MLRVLTLSTLFPDATRPTFGLFVARQTRALSELDDVAVQVVAGIGLPPWPLSRHAHYAPRRVAPPHEEWDGITVHRPRFRVLPRLEPLAGRALARAVLPSLRTLPVDVIDAEFFWPDGVAAMHLSDALGVPFSIKARGSDIHFWGTRAAVRRQMVAASRQAGGLLAVSAALKASMVALGMPEDRIAVHLTGVDLDLFSPVDRSAAKSALGVDGPLLVSAGALIPLKGQALVIEALAALPGVTLLLVGDGPERPALEARAAACGVADRVRFLGNRPHAELPTLLGAADALVLPSQREGLANVWVEALACGTPLVITDVGGASEVVDRPEAGRLIARNAAAIAAGVREVLAAAPAQAAARQCALRFSWSRNAEQLRQHLRRVSSLPPSRERAGERGSLSNNAGSEGPHRLPLSNTLP